MKIDTPACRLLFLLIFSFVSFRSYATHVRAGEITSRRISNTSLTYEFTVTVYCDYERGRPATEAQRDVDVCFGDGSPVERVPILTVGRPAQPSPGLEDIGNNTRRLLFRTTHTFNAPGTYRVSVGIENRNADTRNITNGNSINYPFFVETTLLINAFLGLNNSPVMINPPVDFLACTGQRYIHNPNAFDADGDSLAYRLTLCKTAQTRESCNGFVVPSFTQPEAVPDCAGQNEARSGPATYSINARTGDLVWDAPICAGQYNVAFIVEEWRNGVKIGEITRDMQIIVRDCNNQRPKIDVPEDVCVEAGRSVSLAVRATDADRNPMTLSATGGVFTQVIPPNLINPQFAQFTTVQQPQANPAAGTFTWLTNCTHIRTAPYEVLFKVEDNPGSVQPKLVDSKIVKITVVAPRPTNLRATPNSVTRSFVLTWDPYLCPTTGTEIIIYRREGCSAIDADLCRPVPPAGYVEIGRVPANQTTFTDNTNIRSATQYSYRIAASFPGANNLTRTNGAYSLESCNALPRQSLYIVNASVDSTSTTRGMVSLRWTRPNGAGVTLRGQHQYRLSRGTGINATAFTPVTTVNTDFSQPPVADTLFTDRLLNTSANGFRYRIDLFRVNTDGSTTRLDSAEAASTVRLAALGVNRGIELTWQANTPWSNDNQTHRVYRYRRNNPTQMNLIAVVPVQGTGTYRYTDTGADNQAADGTENIRLTTDSSYCYRVETIGTYNDTKIHTGLLSNFSQISCASPIDTARPCPPALTLDILNCTDYIKQPCESGPYSNKLTWTDPTAQNGEQCDTRIVQYNVYYKRFEEETAFVKVGDTKAPPTPPSKNFTHNGLTSYAGCYYVTAVNRFGVESGRSNIVCNDNCISYALPNVFTPNGDGRNDTFEPLDCPRFVKEVRFAVFNRWGQKVFERSGDPQLRWDGHNANGQELPSGTYYYEAYVNYQRLRQSDENRTQYLKGWVELMR